MLNKKIAIAMAAVLLPLNANAANTYEFMGKNPSHFSYNFAEASFVDNDFDSGFSFGGSYDVTNSIAVIGSYLTAGDFTQLTIGAAHHAKAGFLERSDLVLHATYDKAEYEANNCAGYQAEPNLYPPGSFEYAAYEEYLAGVAGVCNTSVDDSGITAGATLRHELQDRLELFGDVSYSTLYDGDFLITGGVEWSINDKLSVRGSYTLAEIDTLSAGVRYYF